MHKNIHFFERPFRCVPCGVSYKTKGVLDKHRRTEGHAAKVELRKEYPLPGASTTPASRAKEGEGEEEEDEEQMEEEDENPRPYK